MTSHDEVVARLARAINEADMLSDPASRAKAALAALRAGDPLPNQLWAAPEEPTKAMVDAWCALAIARIRRAVRDGVDGKGMAAAVKENYRAMRRAVGGGAS